MFNFVKKRKQQIAEVKEIVEEIVEEISDEDKEAKEIERDHILTELAYLIYSSGLDYLIPYLYEWNVENLDNLIKIKEIYSRHDWLTLCQLNGLYTKKDMKIDNENLKKHDLAVELPTSADILKYRMREEDDKSDNG